MPHVCMCVSGMKLEDMDGERTPCRMKKPVESFELQLNLAPEKAMSRIVKATHGEYRSLRGEQFMAGCLGARTIVQKRWPFMRKMGRALYAHVDPSGPGCEIRGHFGMDPRTQRFMTFLLAAIPVYIVVAAFVVHGLLHGAIPRHDLAATLVPLAMLPFSLLVLALGRYVSRRDPDDISEWLYDLFADVTFMPSKHLSQSR